MSDQRGRRRPSKTERSSSSPDGQPLSKQIKVEQVDDDLPSTSSQASQLYQERDDGHGDQQSNSIIPARRIPAPSCTPTNSRRRYNFDVVHTRPEDIKTKTGELGRRLLLTTNYFRLLTKPKWHIYQYHVQFTPEIELSRIRGGILSEHRSTLGGYIYDGTKIFTTKQLPDAVTELTGKKKNTDEEYQIKIKNVGIISPHEWQYVQILNLILRRSMEGLKLQLVGRNFYDPQARIDLREFRLQLWPGYQTSIRQHECDILLCAEIAHKVMRTETLYDILRKCSENNRNFQEDFTRSVLGLTVLTDYNNKTYQITDIDFTKSPRDTFKCKEQETSFIDYYYQKYHIRIRDPQQPLLISKAKDRTVRAGLNELIILIPELCRATGLTETMRSNFQLMRAMADHTRMNPGRRIERLKVFNNRLQNTNTSMKVLSDWHMSLETDLVEVPGRIFEPQKIVFGGGIKVSADDRGDWTNQFRSNKMFRTPSRGLSRWVVIGTNRSSHQLRGFIDALIQVGSGMQMSISHPREITMYDDRTSDYMKALDDCISQDPQLIFVFLANNHSERYSSIKKKCCLDRAIPTQVITMKSLSNPRNRMSIATKIAIQMNCKLGYTPWMIDIPLHGLMTIGYDVAKSTRDRNKAYAALVATMDMKVNATFYSTVAECNSQDVLANSLWTMMTKALRQYRKEHDNKLPNRILFYRDGVGEGSLQQIYEHEVKDIVEKLGQEYALAKSEKPPMFAYVIVSKKVNTRFFDNDCNPPPGTVVDDVVTLPERYDFYLVSQSVRQGTVSPTSYNVVYSNIKLTPDQMQLLTYKMTHLYYNWTGTVRVPAVCQYAKKLATLVATNLFQPPQNALEKKLFYL